MGYFNICASTVYFSQTGGGVKENEGQRVILSATALLVCMPAEREGEREGLFIFCAPPVQFSRTGGVGLRSVGGSYSQRPCWYVCQREEKQACETFLSFVPPPFTSHGKRGCGERGAGVSLLSEVMHLVYMPADWEGECAGHFFFCPSAVQNSRTGCGWEKQVPAGLILNGGSFGMHVRGLGR